MSLGLYFVPHTSWSLFLSTMKRLVYVMRHLFCPEVLPHHRLKINGGKTMDSETSKIMNKNTLFFTYIVHVRHFVTVNKKSNMEITIRRVQSLSWMVVGCQLYKELSNHVGRATILFPTFPSNVWIVQLPPVFAYPWRYHCLFIPSKV